MQKCACARAQRPASHTQSGGGLAHGPKTLIETSGIVLKYRGEPYMQVLPLRTCALRMMILISLVGALDVYHCRTQREAPVLG